MSIFILDVDPRLDLAINPLDQDEAELKMDHRCGQKVNKK